MIWLRFLFQRWIALARAALLPILLLGVPGVQAGLPEAIQRVKPSVLAVGTYQNTRSPAFLFRGTGFAVDDGTLVATNAHVVTQELKTENGETLMVLVQVASVGAGLGFRLRGEDRVAVPFTVFRTQRPSPSYPYVTV